jgi:hypothetical protein
MFPKRDVTVVVGDLATMHSLHLSQEISFSAAPHLSLIWIATHVDVILRTLPIPKTDRATFLDLPKKKLKIWKTRSQT